MPIKNVYQDRDASGVEHERVELTYVDRVIKVRSYTAQRNHSDTLECTTRRAQR